MTRRTYRLAGEYCDDTFPSTRVGAGERAVPLDIWQSQVDRQYAGEDVKI